MKTPFISAEELQKITDAFPTPFHLYDEKGIREKARALNKAKLLLGIRGSRSILRLRQHRHLRF